MTFKKARRCATRPNHVLVLSLSHTHACTCEGAIKCGTPTRLRKMCVRRGGLSSLHDGDEDAEMAHRLDQLANHADGPRARVEVDAIFSLFCFAGSLLENSGANKRLGGRFLCMFEMSSRSFCSSFRSGFRLPTCRKSCGGVLFGQLAHLLSGSARACCPRHQGIRRCKAGR